MTDIDWRVFQIDRTTGMWWRMLSLVPEDPDPKPIKCCFCDNDTSWNEVWIDAWKDSFCCSKECLLKNIDPVKGG